jgi:hypothetical protein
MEMRPPIHKLFRMAKTGKKLVIKAAWSICSLGFARAGEQE